MKSVKLKAYIIIGSFIVDIGCKFLPKNSQFALYIPCFHEYSVHIIIFLRQPLGDIHFESLICFSCHPSTQKTLNTVVGNKRMKNENEKNEKWLKLLTPKLWRKLPHQVKFCEKLNQPIKHFKVKSEKVKVSYYFFLLKKQIPFITMVIFYFMYILVWYIMESRTIVECTFIQEINTILNYINFCCFFWLKWFKVVEMKLIYCLW